MGKPVLMIDVKSPKTHISADELIERTSSMLEYHQKPCTRKKVIDIGKISKTLNESQNQKHK